MLFGIRECADVVLRAKTAQKIGNKIFYKNEPVCYFETLKTSTFEGAATTVYAQGGKGNTRLMSWDGERTVTFTMEDALISPTGLAILTGAGLIDADANHKVIQHNFERKIVQEDLKIELSETPYVTKEQDTIYVMKVDADNQIQSEPYIYTQDVGRIIKPYGTEGSSTDGTGPNGDYRRTAYGYNSSDYNLSEGDTVLIDYYTAYDDGAIEIQITPDKFGGNFYLEASTLWRDKTTGKDLPAEFIIPNCRVQSNFSFTLSSSGDPSTFTFTMDAFPDYTRFNESTKVLADIQVIGVKTDGVEEYTRPYTRTTDYDPENLNTDNWDENSETIIRKIKVFANNVEIDNGGEGSIADNTPINLTFKQVPIEAEISEAPTDDNISVKINNSSVGTGTEINDNTIVVVSVNNAEPDAKSKIVIKDKNKKVIFSYTFEYTATTE